MLTPAAVSEARERIRGAAIRTPLVRLHTEGGEGGREIYLKLENLQPIGSFKIRGAASAMRNLSKAALAGGVVTASGGNMAQGVAWTAREMGIHCTVIAPDTAPEVKVRAIRGLGATVVQVSFERWWQTFEERRYPGIDGAFIHAFDDEDVMAGNGTIALEILEDLPEVDAILVPWGGGGLACGIAETIKSLRPATRVYAIELETGAPLQASWSAGSPQSVDYRPSFVDGIGGPTVFPRMLKRARECLDGSLVATLEQVTDAVRTLATRAHVVAEGAGAAATAVAQSHAEAPTGKVACIISGGNIDTAKLAKILAG